MSQPLRLVETSPNPPARADVVVIGGGIIGVFTAYYLARRGLSVAVVEKGRIGAEQSSRNWGWCRQQNRDARELPMATRSLELWEQFAADTGEDTGFSRCGLLYLSDDESELARWARWRDFAKTAGVTTHMLSGRRGLAAGPGDRPRMERRRVLVQRRHGRSRQGGARRGSRADEAGRQRPPELRSTGHRARGRPGQRRGHRSGDHQDPHCGSRRWCVGVLVLPPARRAVSARHGAPIHRARVPAGTAPAGRPGGPGCRRHPAPRRQLHTGHQRPWARGPDAAADALRAAVRAHVRQALAQCVSRRPGRHPLGS